MVPLLPVHSCFGLVDCLGISAQTSLEPPETETVEALTLDQVPRSGPRGVASFGGEEPKLEHGRSPVVEKAQLNGAWCC